MDTTAEYAAVKEMSRALNVGVKNKILIFKISGLLIYLFSIYSEINVGEA